MKFIKKRNQFEAANVTLNVDELTAYSYGWWQFLAVINGVLVFNNYGYSNSTRKHQSKVRRMLEEKGIKIDLEVSTRVGLGNGEEALKGAIISVQREIGELESILSNNRRKKALDHDRKEQIQRLNMQILRIERVLAPLPLDRALLEVV